MKSRILLSLAAGLSIGLSQAAAHQEPAPAVDNRREVAEFATGLIIGMLGQAAAEKMGAPSIETLVKAILEGNEYIESAIASGENLGWRYGEGALIPLFIKNIQLLINHFKSGGISGGTLAFTSGIMQSIPHVPTFGPAHQGSFIDTPATTAIRAGLHRISALRCGMAIGSNLKMLARTYQDQNTLELGINVFGLLDLVVMSAHRYFIP